MLFADVVGFTGYAEQRDPEHVKRLIDACFQRLVADIDAHGGRVDKILGDGILALFGAPLAHEDDAERGVRTGLAMQATADAFARERDVPIRLRVGVSTGEVLVGALRAGGDYTALGDVVNVASRLQAEAPPGGVLVGPTTFAATRGVIAYEPAGALAVRGRVEPVEAWLARETLALPGARRPGRRVRLVGRDGELATMASAAQVAIDRGRPLVLAIEGEGGMGKSRLAEELVEAVTARSCALSVAGRCLPYGETSPLAPLAWALRPLLALPEEGLPERTEVLEAIKQLGSELPLPAERVVDAVLHLLGGATPLADIEPESAMEEIVRALAAMLAGAARRRPVVVRMGDLHWGDAQLLSVLARVMAQLPAVGVILVTTARPAEAAAWPPVDARHSTFLFRLDPLSADDADALAALALGEGDDPALRREVLARSGGNPLFIEHFAALVGENGPGAAMPLLPDTLRGLVAARLDALSPDQRAMLDNAAILGTSGRWPNLEHFGQAIRQQPTRATLEALASADLLVLEGNGWRFRSPTVREVAYQTLTKSVRALRHAGVARAIEEKMADGKDEAEVLAYHWLVAASLAAELGKVQGMPPDVLARALHWSRLAARHALGRQAYTSAERFADDALALLDDDRRQELDDDGLPSRLRLLLARSDARLGLERPDAARADLEAVVAAVPTLPEPLGDRILGYAERLLGLVDHKGGRVDAARAHLEQAIVAFRRTDDEAGLALALRTLGMVLVIGGYFADSEAPLREAQERYATLGDRRGKAWVHQHLARAAFARGDRVEADARLDEADALFSALGDHNGRSWVLGLRAFLRFQQGRLDDAEALASVVLREAEEHNDRWASAMMRNLLGGLRLWSGRVSEALALGEKSRAGFRALGDRYGEAQVTGLLVRAGVAAGQTADAQRHLEALAAMADSASRRAFVALVQAGASAHAGEPRRAVVAAEQALAAGSLDGIGLSEAWAALALARLQLGDADAAAVAAARAAQADADAPYIASVEAATAVACGETERAVELAARVASHPGASYLDHVIAVAAGAIARVGQARYDAAEELIADAAAVAATSEDPLVAAMVNATQAMLDAARAGLAADIPDGVLPPAWSRAWETMSIGAGAAVAGRAVSPRRGALAAGRSPHRAAARRIRNAGRRPPRASPPPTSG